MVTLWAPFFVSNHDLRRARPWLPTISILGGPGRAAALSAVGVSSILGSLASSHRLAAPDLRAARALALGYFLFPMRLRR